MEEPDFHGCAFITASAEAPPGGLVERAVDQFRAWLRDLLTDLAEDAAAPDPAGLGRQLHLVYNGAGLEARMDNGDPATPPAARAAAQALLDAALVQAHPTPRY